ncbi:MAG: transglycosylase domain-containing protein [Quinella sp. 1Q7]|nr:transglycosylase domain-containing protein [Quinella sp. 1Q7]
MVTVVQIVCGVICLLIVVGMAATIYLWRTARQLLKAMIRAVLYTIRSGRYYGGSTITQQLVKNVYLTHERTIRRKALEVIIALYIDWGAMLSKDEILELYLNLAEMEPKIFGIGAAYEYHFGKRASRLTLNQAVILATTMPSPFRHRPVEAPLFFEKMRNKSCGVIRRKRALTPNCAVNRNFKHTDKNITYNAKIFGSSHTRRA